MSLSIELHRRAVRILRARLGLVSNNPDLISNPEFFEATHLIQSLLTDVYSVDNIPFDDNLDACFYIFDLPGIPPSISTSEREVWARGNFSELEAGMRDRRYSLFGNLGLLFRYSMATLERYHDIYSFHASAMYVPQEGELILIIGGAGAGKTVLLLEGLGRGYQIFSTEMAHFRLDGQGCSFFKGALIDNVRLGNLLYDFPKAADRLRLHLPQVADVWGTKISIDLGVAATEEDVIVNPKVTLLFPRIEAERSSAIVDDIADRRQLVKMLFDNATEKIGGTALLYESIPVGSLDTPDLMRKRLAIMERFAAGEVDIVRAKRILAGSKNCMEGI